MKIEICCKGMADLLSLNNGMILGIFYCPYCGEKIEYLDELHEKEKAYIREDRESEVMLPVILDAFTGNNPLYRDSVGTEEMGE